MLTLLVFLLILSILVLIHEAGHFFVAKKLGIKVEEFGFGLPPRLWGKKIGETIYSINWLPIGGFVKLFGEDEAGGGRISLPIASSKYQVVSKKENKHATNYKLHTTGLGRAFFTRPVGQRAAVVVAGVVMNAILAVVIYYVFLAASNFKAELPLFGEFHFFGTNQSVKSEIFVSEISKNSPAAKAHIPPGAKILSINNKKITDIARFAQTIKNNRGIEIMLVFEDPNTHKIKTVRIIPRINPPKNQGAVGIKFFPVDTAILSYDTPTQKIFSGFIHPANLLIYNFDVMYKLLKVSLAEHSAAPISEGVSGPVGIYSLVGTIVQIPDLKERLLQILNLAGLLSISLAFFNVLPIPALDGGRLFFIFIEGISGKKLNAKYESLVNTVGMAFLLMLILLVTFKDIFQHIIPNIIK